MRVMTVFGTRPEAIKMAPVVKALSNVDCIETKVCVTSQHREMLDQVLDVFSVRPNFDLDIMSAKQDLTDVTASVLRGLREVFHSWAPDLVLVHGDTTTAFAAGLASYYRQISVGHVEAGLRTFNRYSPWPEEMNRKLVGSLANVHFAPTDVAKANLLAEGIPAAAIHVVGNTVIDALLEVASRLETDVKLGQAMKNRFGFLDWTKRLVLVTGHRRESFGSGFDSICLALRRIAQRGDVNVVYPVHLNPRVRVPVEEVLGNVEGVHLLEPLNYLEFVYLMKMSALVLTDSGGIQEEAPSLGKPVLVMRETTERPEALLAGVAILVGTSADRIVDNVSRLLDDTGAYEQMARCSNPYGNGTAAAKIAEVVGSCARDGARF